jgi:mutator protein MutT
MTKAHIRVVAAVVELDGKFLLAKRPAHKSQAGFWEFPGGKVEDGEGPQAALARELVEELDARDVVVGGCVGAANHDYGTGVIRIEAYRAACDVASLRCLEHEAMGWFHTHEFEALPLAPADLFLKEILEEARHGGNAAQGT